MNRRLIRLSEQGGFWSVDYDGLTPAKRVFRIVWELEAEVNNGGFDQYFFNSSGRLACYALDALLAIQAPSMAAIVRDAIEAVGGDPPWAGDGARQGRVINLTPAGKEKLEALDRQFWRYPDSLTELLYLYVVKHRDEFGAPADFYPE
jgi:hypothetical protein